MELFAWIGEDEHYDGISLKMVVTPFGPTNAVAVKRDRMEHPVILAQMQAMADALNRPMRLVRFVEADVVTTFTPRPRG
jgi:hypothetical protein